MKKYRMPMPSKMAFITFSRMNYLLMGNYEVGKEVIINYSNMQIILMKSCDERLNLFDIAVLHALHTIYLETNGSRIFTTLNVLKILLGNKNANFCLKCAKEKTITHEQLVSSMNRLSSFQIKKINQEHLDVNKLIDVKIDKENLEFVNEPSLVSLLQKGYLQSMNLYNFELSLFRLKKTGMKQYIHSNMTVIKFEFYVLDIICNSEGTIRFENRVLKRLLNIDIEEKRLTESYRSKKLSYELYRKKIRELESCFCNRYLNSFMVNLHHHKMIETYDITKNFTVIVK